MRIVVAHVDKRLCVLTEKRVKCQSIVKFVDRWNSSVTHDIAKIDNYSVYRWLGNKIIYFAKLLNKVHFNISFHISLFSFHLLEYRKQFILSQSVSCSFVRPGVNIYSENFVSTATFCSSKR